MQEQRKLEISKAGAGIYYITGDEFPIQLLITKELDPEENLWLQSLRKDIEDTTELETLLRTYELKKHSKLYQAAMNVITRANWSAMMEVKGTMCEALRELMADEFDAFEEQVTKRVTEKVTEQVTETGASAIIQLAQKYNLPEDDIIDQLCGGLHLSPEKAKALYLKYQ